MQYRPNRTQVSTMAMMATVAMTGCLVGIVVQRAVSMDELRAPLDAAQGGGAKVGEEADGLASRQQPIDINLDKESAVKIAEIILVKVYGERVLRQRPWQVAETKSSFTITGTLPKPRAKGGVATIRISRRTAEVSGIEHGK
jgi:hypothetical protein